MCNVTILTENHNMVVFNFIHFESNKECNGLNAIPALILKY